MTSIKDIQLYLSKFKNRVVPTLRLRDLSWTIHIWSGSSPFELAAPRSVKNPVLSASHVNDLNARFVADPFLVNEGGCWYMFFEALESKSGRGVICLATSINGYDWTYKRVVLREAFHLSYPYTFKKDNTYYMVPESAEDASVRLYKAVQFPTKWTFTKELLKGHYWDPSIVQFEDMWWLFSHNKLNGANDLRLHFASELTGHWQEHPCSPLITNNPHFTRPGGRILRLDGRLFRIAQDTYPEYGLQLFAFEILELSTTSYAERPVGERPIITGKGKVWFRDRIHHLDAHRISDGNWIAAIDYLHPRIKPRLQSRRKDR